MINWQETLLFPVRDSESRKQFLIACLVMLAGFIIPLLPTFVLLGYCVKIMRQVLEDRTTPSMPDWQTSDWSQMLMDGLRLFGAQISLTLPLLILLGCGVVTIIIGSTGLSVSTANENIQSFTPIGILFFIIGIGMTTLSTLISFPYGIIITAALPHVVAKNSFAAAFQIKEWFPIFRKALGQFILGYLMIMVASFVFMFIIQFAMITIILICIVPFLMIPYIAYLSIVSNVIYAQAYMTGLDAPQLENHATA